MFWTVLLLSYAIKKEKKNETWFSHWSLNEAMLEDYYVRYIINSINRRFTHCRFSWASREANEAAHSFP